MTTVDVSDEALLAAKDAYERAGEAHKTARERVQADVASLAAVRTRESEIITEYANLSKLTRESRVRAIDALVDRIVLPPNEALELARERSLGLYLAAMTRLAVWRRPDAERAVLVAELAAATAEAEVFEAELTCRQLLMAKTVSGLSTVEGEIVLTGQGSAGTQRAIAFARETAAGLVRRIDAHDKRVAKMREDAEK